MYPVTQERAPFSTLYSRKPTEEISGQTDCCISYLVRSETTTKMAQCIAAPKELFSPPNMDEILFSGSESKQHGDPLKPSQVLLLYNKPWPVDAGDPFYCD